MNKVFGPAGPTTTLAATTTTSRVALPSRNIRIYNGGSNPVFVRFGDSTVTAAAANAMPLPAGGVEVFNHADATHLAAIYASGSGTVYITPGEGF